ncbi:MAG: aminotransferase class V-fold PLP-dependent enzyme [Firmicutes bacterium]|nr:aminotransferase class V-fold PLP-dependent enzyme [Bacillota bacterium]
MIYLDNAAGSHPKPTVVANAMYRAMTELGASPGRGRHALARHTASLVEQVRGQLARLIHAPDAEQVVFTAGATMSLNMAVFGWLFPRGGHVLSTSMEHNAMIRPLRSLEQQGRIRLELLQADRWGYVDAAELLHHIRPDTSLVAISHGSNVNGAVQPLEEIAAICSRMGIPLLVDASQSLGLLPIDVQKLDIAMLAMAGHKALYGPAGVGALYVRPGMELLPLLSGGTGGQSELPAMPEEYPQHLEAGSLNVCGIAGLGAALDFLEAADPGKIYQHCMKLCAMLADQAAVLPGVKIHWGRKDRPRLPVLAMEIYGFSPEEAAEALDALGVCVRAGYQCAPLAHESLGSLEQDGLIRFSPSRFTGSEDIRLCVLALDKIIREKDGSR